MLGHQLFKSLKKEHLIRVTLRQDMIAYEKFALFDASDSYCGIDIRCFEQLVDVVADFKPNAIINCIGIVKQRTIAKESIPSIEVNALLPHRLAVLCEAIGARLIHLSTDCVFSGKKGNYLESDLSDAEDLYGKTKYLGEVQESHCLTLRTSIIGIELSRKKSLLEWFLSQTGSVKGYTNAIYSGFTTIEMAQIINMMLLNYPNASGVYHVASDSISKYELLSLINSGFNKNLEIIPDNTFSCNRTLDSTRFRTEFSYSPPSWNIMIDDLANQ